MVERFRSRIPESTTSAGVDRSVSNMKAPGIVSGPGCDSSVHLREHGTQREGVGVADETRAAGWYDDPWGTNDERYFDGSAWTRQTRLIGASDAVTLWPGVLTTPDPSTARVSGSDDAPPATAAALAHAAIPSVDAVGPTAAPPGWHPDPWKLSSLRWWDGTAWTGHVSGPSAAKSVDIVGERALARWVHPLLLVGGAVQALAMFANASQAKWFVEHWDELTTPGGSTPTPPSGSTLTGLVFPLTIAVSVLFMLWFYRAASTGWASGLPARRGPLLSTLSFIIPILNLWWPYQAAMDMVPADDGRRVLIQRWWALWLVGTLCGYLIYPAQAIFNETATRMVAGVGAVAMVAAALAARVVVQYITTTHERLSQAAAAG